MPDSGEPNVTAEAGANVTAAGKNVTGGEAMAANKTEAGNLTEVNHESGDVVDFMFDHLQRPLGGTLASHFARGTTAELMKIKRNGPEDLDSLVSAGMTSLAIVATCLVILKVLHGYLPGLYGTRAASQGGTPPWIAGCGGPLGQALATAELDAMEMMRTAGLDALMVREFHALCRKIFGVLSFATLLVLGPLHFLASRAGSADYLSALDVGAVLGLADLTKEAFPELDKFLELRKVPCWAHAVEVWLVVLLCLRLIFTAQDRFLQRRFQWLQSIRPPRATTLMVEGIPAELRSDDKLREYYGRLFTPEAVERTYVVRRARELKRLVGEVKQLEERLAVARANAQAGDQTSKLREALNIFARWVLLPSAQGEPQALEAQLAEARAAAQEERKRVEEAVQLLDPAVCSSSGFVTFATRRWCRLASREQLRADAGALRMSMPPDPDDVLFEDLAEDTTRSTVRQSLALLLKFAVVCCWMPIVVSLACMADLATLKRTVPFVGTACKRWPTLEPMLQGFLASFMLQVLMGQLPKVIMMIIKNFEHLKSGAWAQLDLQRTFFLLQIVFVLLVTAINQTVLSSLRVLLKEPHMVFVLLADNLPNSSHFYLNYMAVGWAGLATAALRSGMLLSYVGSRVAGSTPEEARERAEENDAQSVNNGTGVRMSRATFMATVGLVFCTCTPLITPLAWAYFAIGEHIFPYLLVCGENRQPDLGGAFWLSALEGLLVALGLFVLLEVGILGRAGDPLAAAAAAAAFIALLVGRSHLQHLRGEILPFEAVVDVECADGEPGAEKRPLLANHGAATYQQPECRAEKEKDEA